MSRVPLPLWMSPSASRLHRALCVLTVRLALCHPEAGPEVAACQVLTATSQISVRGALLLALG